MEIWENWINDSLAILEVGNLTHLQIKHQKNTDMKDVYSGINNIDLIDRSPWDIYQN